MTSTRAHTSVPCLVLVLLVPVREGQGQGCGLGSYLVVGVRMASWSVQPPRISGGKASGCEGLSPAGAGGMGVTWNLEDSEQGQGWGGQG